ncbi:uncharacterized protein BDW70DRAFT_36632 [Aspergillus foveolatus]|uniref:uncharacterized protein n=1 Tax=Aspergillus foveolatus TaxID=210207 RepID=UPI003CCCC146
MAFPDLPPLWSGIQLVVFLTTVFLWLSFKQQALTPRYSRLSTAAIIALHQARSSELLARYSLVGSSQMQASGRLIRLHLLYRLCPNSYPSRSMGHLLTPRTIKLEHNRNGRIGQGPEMGGERRCN